MAQIASRSGLNWKLSNAGARRYEEEMRDAASVFRHSPLSGGNHVKI
jgi:hypothetical protein